MRPRLPLLLLAAALTLVTGAPAAAAPDTQRLRPLSIATGDEGTRVYVVQLAEPPAASEPRLRRTAERAGPGVRPGRRFDPRDQRVRAYGERLVARQDALLAEVGAGQDKVYSYRYAFNGFAARLTPAQARKLAGRKDVRGVWENRVRYVETNASPAFLGLNDPASGLTGAFGLTGEDVVIGVIDSGITPGHPSFTDRQGARRPRLCRSTWAETSLLGLWLCRRFRNREDEILYGAPADWRGACETGPGFARTDCNNKLIGARFYLGGFLDLFNLDTNEFRSPRDADGHGTHIASTAAGNRVRATLAGTQVATITGIAPRARIAAYKACWLEPGQLRGSCSIADLTRAIEDAVADGVDIINYSVGSFDDINDPDDLALLAAADAGVLAVAAAGNEGPMPGTMLSPAAAPWVVAVGASSRTGDRFRQALRVDEPAGLAGNYAAIEAGFTPPLASVGPVTEALVLADDGVIGIFDGRIGTTWDACETLRNTGETSGRIVLVQRGGCTFEAKVRNVQNAGGKAAVVVNDQGEPLIMVGTRNSVGIPAMMVGQADGERFRQELGADTTLKLTLDRGLILRVRDPGNVMEGFSARGPSPWTPDILKPDVTAPGVEILAGHTPDAANNVRGESFQYLSGTSMAVPHVAGIAALIREAWPELSPAAIKSALVTTARQDILREDGETPADPFDFGGGHVVPNAAIDPGLVYDAGPEDFDAYLCGRGEARPGVDCTALADAGYPTGGPDLNLPALAVSDFVHEQVIRRRVTNVGDAAQYVASVEAPSTFDVEVVPAILSLGPGETAEFEVRLGSGGTTLDAWQFGALRWTAGNRTVRSPLAIRALALGVPPVVSGSGDPGSLSFALRVGYSGAYTAGLAGFEASGESQPPEVQAGLLGATVLNDPFRSYRFVQPGAGSVPASVRRLPIVVAPGTRLLRVALFNDATDGDDDLDLYLYECPGFSNCEAEADPSTNEDSNEAITILDPPPGQYYVDVHGYRTDGPSATFDLFVWTLGPDRGNGTVTAPASVVPGARPTVTVDWQDLSAGRNLGLIVHSDGTETLDYTLLEVTP